MRLSEAQRDLALELLHGVGAQFPALLEAWREAGENDPPPDELTPHELFVTIRRIPCDMKPEDGSFRYHQVPPHEGVWADRADYFYEPAPPNGFPSMLVVITWRGPMPAELQAVSPPPAPTGDA
jgi:hypothetical protein